MIQIGYAIDLAINENVSIELAADNEVLIYLYDSDGTTLLDSNTEYWYWNFREVHFCNEDSAKRIYILIESDYYDYYTLYIHDFLNQMNLIMVLMKHIPFQLEEHPLKDISSMGIQIGINSMPLQKPHQYLSPYYYGYVNLGFLLTLYDEYGYILQQTLSLQVIPK